MFFKGKFGHGGARNRESNCSIKSKDLYYNRLFLFSCVQLFFPLFPFIETDLLPGT
jgi:hypothetical protein